MVAKLPSILGRTDWSSALKGVLFGAAWYALPLWAFIPIAAYLYLVPLFRPLRVAVPYLAALVLASVLAKGIGAAFLLGIVFWGILGIKDLVSIHRGALYQLVVLALLYTTFFVFFERFGAAASAGALIATPIPAAVFFVFVVNLMWYLGRLHAFRRRVYTAAAVGAMAIWQLALALLVVPMGVPYQALALFLASAAFVDLLVRRRLAEPGGVVPRRWLLVDATVVLVTLTLIFASVRWSL